MPKYHYVSVSRYGRVACIEEPGTGSLKQTFNPLVLQVQDDEGRTLLDTSLVDGSVTPQIVSRARGIAQDRHGHIFVAAILVGGTTTNQVGDTAIVLKYDDQGRCMNALGWDISDYFHTTNIEDIAVDDRGFIYIGSSGDTTTRCVLVLDDEGRVIRDFGTSV